MPNAVTGSPSSAPPMAGELASETSGASGSSLLASRVPSRSTSWAQSDWVTSTATIAWSMAVAVSRSATMARNPALLATLSADRTRPSLRPSNCASNPVRAELTTRCTDASAAELAERDVNASVVANTSARTALVPRKIFRVRLSPREATEGAEAS